MRGKSHGPYTTRIVAAGGTPFGTTALHEGIDVANGRFTDLVNEAGHFGPEPLNGAGVAVLPTACGLASSATDTTNSHGA